jgi:hypothetical protein
MKYKFLAATALAMMVAACGGGSKEAEKQADAGPVKREAGNWKTEIKLISLNVPGMNDQMKSGMSKVFEGMSGIETCLTPEQAAKEDLAKDMSKNAAQGADCTFSKQDVGGGKIDVAGSCKTPQGQAMDIAMTGTLEAKKVDVTATVKGGLPGNAGNMEMVMQMTNTHTGACKAT